MEAQQLAAFFAALALAMLHVFGGRLRLLDVVPRSRWLSAAGGVSVAYVFMHLLPELAEGQAAIEGEEGGAEAEDAAPGPVFGFLEHHVYLVALLGLAIFYGVEKRSLDSRRQRKARTGEDQTAGDAFWLSIGSFALYNAVVAYLLLREELEALFELLLFTAALAVHLLINDVSLREHHKDAYDRIGRWLVAGAVLIGWAVGVFAEIPERVIALVIAFLAGGIVLNVCSRRSCRGSAGPSFGRSRPARWATRCCCSSSGPGASRTPTARGRVTPGSLRRGARPGRPQGSASCHSSISPILAEPRSPVRRGLEIVWPLPPLHAGRPSLRRCVTGPTLSCVVGHDVRG